jgi:hypothetical protein
MSLLSEYLNFLDDSNLMYQDFKNSDDIDT